MYNVKDAVKLLEKSDSIYKRGAFRTVSNVQGGAFVKMWYYEYTLESEYARVLNLAGIHKVLNMREYALE